MKTIIFKSDFIKEISYKNDEGLKRRREFFKHEVNQIDICSKTVDILSALPGFSILDVGCGFGDVFLQLREKKHVGRLVGIDVAPAMIASAENINSQKKLGIDFLVADAHQLPFSDGEFDIISCNFALYMFEHIEQVIQEIYRCLKPGGYFVGSLHQKENRPRWVKFFRQAHILLDCEPQEFTTDRISIDTIETFLKNFTLKDIRRFESPIHIFDAAIFLDYFDTSRTVHFFPVPSNEQWDRVLEAVGREIQEEINRQGYFEEFTRVGIFIAQK